MGGRPEKSTTTALELLTEATHKVWQSGGKYIVTALSLDMSGAFDNVSHPRLIHILKMEGIPSWIVNFVKSSLKGRMSTIAIDNWEGEKFNITNEIPQGSLLSLILFLLFNLESIELCNTRNSVGVGFVDDANVII